MFQQFKQLFFLTSAFKFSLFSSLTLLILLLSEKYFFYFIIFCFCPFKFYSCSYIWCWAACVCYMFVCLLLALQVGNLGKGKFLFLGPNNSGVIGFIFKLFWLYIYGVFVRSTCFFAKWRLQAVSKQNGICYDHFA